MQELGDSTYKSFKLDFNIVSDILFRYLNLMYQCAQNFTGDIVTRLRDGRSGEQD